MIGAAVAQGAWSPTTWCQSSSQVQQLVKFRLMGSDTGAERPRGRGGNGGTEWKHPRGRGAGLRIESPSSGDIGSILAAYT